MSDLLAISQQLEAAKVADDLQDRLNICPVGAAVCNVEALQLINEQPKWSAREMQCANPPAKIGTDVIDGNALPMPKTPESL